MLAQRLPEKYKYPYLSADHLKMGLIRKKDFDEEYLNEIQYWYLVMTKEYVENHFSDIRKYANAVEYRLDDSDCTIRSIMEENVKKCECAKDTATGISSLIKSIRQILIECGRTLTDSRNSGEGL